MSVTFSISTSIAQFYLILRGMMVATTMMMTMMMTVRGGRGWGDCIGEFIYKPNVLNNGNNDDQGRSHHVGI